MLIAIALSIATFIRSELELKLIVKEERPSFPFFLRVFPPLGRFTLLHLSNYLIILLGIVMVVRLTENPSVQFFGSLVLGIFLFILPILEISEYGSIINGNIFQPKSYYLHVLSVIFTGISTFTYVSSQVSVINFIVLRGGSISGTEISILNFFLYLFVSSPIPSLIGWALFTASLYYLRREIQDMEEPDDGAAT